MIYGPAPIINTILDKMSAVKLGIKDFIYKLKVVSNHGL